MNLKQLRKRKGLLQRQVAMQLGVSPQAYSNYENGIREPNIKTLIKLADYFGVSLDVLVKGKEPYKGSNS